MRCEDMAPKLRAALSIFPADYVNTKDKQSIKWLNSISSDKLFDMSATWNENIKSTFYESWKVFIVTSYAHTHFVE